ncbi:MAG: PDZ domain-containing protein [Alicyclobacillus sp.]|nr:PDZ domain-containing protein [Alicyclobacillus sp.]
MRPDHRFASDLHGTLVLEVGQGGPADQAGIQPGHVIVSFDDEDVRSYEDFETLLFRHKPGDEVSVGIVRNGSRQTVPLRLAPFPAGM